MHCNGLQQAFPLSYYTSKSEQVEKSLVLPKYYMSRQALLYLYISDQLVTNYNDNRQPCLLLVVCNHNMTPLASYFTIKMKKI